MDKDTPQTPSQDDLTEQQAAPEGQDSLFEGAEEQGSGLEAELAAEVERLSHEVAGLKDQLLRALAETENVRARARREKEDVLKYASAPLAKDLLPVADNLRRAIESVKDEEQSEAISSLLDGVRMTEKALIDAFSKHHIQAFNPAGERLDPHRHEAMFEVEDLSQPQGTVVQVFEQGYALHDRLLRPARVGVSKGGPKEAPAADGAQPGSHLDTEA